MQHDPSASELHNTADRLEPYPDQRSLQAIVANNTNALLVLDHAGTVLFANEAALRLFGRQADQVQGSPFGFPLQPGLTVDAEIVRPDHSVVIVDLRVEPIEWDGSPAMLVILHDITERKQAEQLLIETQQLLHSALDALPSAIAILDRYGQVLAANVRWLQLGPLLGVEAIDCTVGAAFLAACQLGVGPAVVVAVAIEQLLASELESYEGEFAAVTHDRCWLAMRAVRFGSGERVRVVVVLEDVSARHQVEQIALARRRVLELIARQYELRTIIREMLQLLGEQITDLVYAAYMVRSAAVFASYNRYILHDDLPHLDQWASELLTQLPYHNQRVSELSLDSPHWQKIQDLIQMQVINRSWLIVLRTHRDPADGWLLLCRQSDMSLAFEEQQLLDHIEQLTTIALEQHVTLHKLAYQAHHDALTGLPNRLLFEDRLQHAIEHARRNTLVAVLFIDLDRFKQVNDTLGHAIGDLLLVQVARRFELCVRATDTLARHGGDEFLLVLPEINSPQQVTAIARRLHEALEQPFFINGHEIFVSVSIGASLYPIDGTDVMTLQRAADMAMYRAKGTLRNSFQFFDAAITNSSLEQLQIETLLRRAIECNELLLHYQPKVNRAGKLVGFEALIRWQNAELGMVSPARFIPIAEDTGLIISIGAWVLREIARQMREWRAQGLPIVPVAANVSALQFSQSGFVQTVAETLAQADLPLGWLELELTESMLMGQIDNLRRQMIELRQLGVTLAIDDFGTGYSSLSYLHRLPINVLKIDRSFVAQLDHSDAMIERSLVSTIISLGHHLGTQIVAEGVETIGQRQILLDAGCDLFQGYYISHPLPAEAAASWLHARTEANES
ncbi:EAL domain-containing protein [uncultured Chloroflexus sp.]|uniref:sensor domain-containing protein n=1 Tax=uncultured Chloroflexus sp. TaxID=214040 RepID=UPI0026037757|nr:EAL domain-containing protein [uncultured Chloroflexus sp.]